MAASLLQPPSHQMSRFALLTIHKRDMSFLLLLLLLVQSRGDFWAAGIPERQAFLHMGVYAYIMGVYVLVTQVCFRLCMLPCHDLYSGLSHCACVSDPINSVLHSICRYMKSGMTSRMLTRALPK